MERIREMMNRSSGGIITTDQITKAGIHRGLLKRMVEDGELVRVCRGIYACCGHDTDEFLVLQTRYAKGIFSNETALYLHGYSDRVPVQYTMTFPKGYNSAALRQENLIIKRVVPENYDLGCMELYSPYGNQIYVYDLERTLCDIVRGAGADIQIVLPAMRRYAVSRKKDIHRLFQYAEQLRVEPKIRRYMEVLL